MLASGARTGVHVDELMEDSVVSGTEVRAGMEIKASGAPATVKSALRVLLLIELLTEEPDGLTFAHALLLTMRERDHLKLDQQGRYRLGIRIWQAGQACMQVFDIATAARPHLQAVRDELRETVQLAVLDGIENVYLAKEDSDQRLVLQSRVGVRLPAYATGLGKVLLSGLSDDEVLARLSATDIQTFTPNTITKPSKLLAQLRKIRQQGYGMDYGEHTQGVICVAVPVKDAVGEVIAAISVSVPEIRADLEFQRRAVEVLTREAASLSFYVGNFGLATL
jgi:IclR family KDG regulon transcriptional repressor